MSGLELNGMQCVGMDFSDDTLGAYLEAGDITELDKDGVMMADIVDGWDGDEDDTYEEDDALENQEIANAYCRFLYDLNELEDGFCCQALALDSEGETPLGIITTASKAEEAKTGLTLFGVEVLLGAEVFASAKAMTGSLLTLATTALVFAH